MINKGFYKFLNYSFREQNCREMEDFLSNTKLLFSKGMNRHLLLQEKEVRVSDAA